jgi:hypothetical protein
MPRFSPFSVVLTDEEERCLQDTARMNTSPNLRVRALRDPPNVENVVRVVVCENPGARASLSRKLFTGIYDERWAIEERVMSQVFVGRDTWQLEPR